MLHVNMLCRVWLVNAYATVVTCHNMMRGCHVMVTFGGLKPALHWAHMALQGDAKSSYLTPHALAVRSPEGGQRSALARYLPRQNISANRGHCPWMRWWYDNQMMYQAARSQGGTAHKLCRRRPIA